MSLREQQAEETKNRIIDKAVRLFYKHGYAKTSLATIVAAAKVTKGAFYHHFDNKEALYIACYSKQAQRLVETLQEVPESPDPIADALNRCEAFLQFGCSRSNLSIPIQEAITVLGWQRWRALDTSFTMGELLNVVERIVTVAPKHSLDKEILADMVYGMLVNAMVTLSQSSNLEDTRREMMRVLGVFFGGILRGTAYKN